MRKFVGVLLSGLVLVFLLYTCVFPLLERGADQPRNVPGESEVDTALAEQSVGAAEPDSLSLDTAGTVSIAEATSAGDSVKQTPERPDRPTSMAWPHGAPCLPPLSPNNVDRVAELSRIEEIEAPTVLAVLSRPTQEEGEPERLRLSIPDRVAFTATATHGQPSSTINTPTAFGPRWKQVYAGVGYQNRIRYDDWRDGVAAVGAGIGDPEQYVGLDVRLNILDAYTDFAEDRSLSLKLHRQLPYRSAVAVGYENVWHTDGTDGGRSRYAVVSKVLLLRGQPTKALGSAVVNFGLGTDRFLPEQRFARGDEGLNAFGSVALRMHPRLNAIANWTGQDLAVGVSIVPFETWPVVITPALMDVTGRAGDGARFSVSVGLDHDFGR